MRINPAAKNSVWIWTASIWVYRKLVEIWTYRLCDDAAIARVTHLMITRCSSVFAPIYSQSHCITSTTWTAGGAVQPLAFLTLALNGFLQLMLTSRCDNSTPPLPQVKSSQERLGEMFNVPQSLSGRGGKENMSCRESYAFVQPVDSSDHKGYLC
jgi:hypothetical protein